VKGTPNISHLASLAVKSVDHNRPGLPKANRSNAGTAKGIMVRNPIFVIAEGGREGLEG
jgi:hypothetical protein